MDSSGKTACVCPAAASNLLISRISAIWLPNKKKGGPPKHVKNLDPPRCTTFPHSAQAAARAGRGAQKEGSDSPGGCSSGELALEPDKSSRRHAHPQRKEAAARKPGFGRPRNRASSRRPNLLERQRQWGERPENCRGETVPPDRVGRAWGGGERRRKGGPPRARHGAGGPLPLGLPGLQAPSSEPWSSCSLRPPSAPADPGNAYHLSGWKDLNSRC